MKPPRISVVTASFNRVTYLREAIDSVLAQRYPALEYVVVDGGSSDGSAEVVASYADRLAWWVTERDQGQYHAINKGFAHTTGDVMAWLNSDDLYLPWTLSLVGEIFTQLPEVEWLTTAFPMTWDRDGRAVNCTYRPGYARSGFLRGEYLPGDAWYASGFVQQESTFWRRSLWERCGGALDTQYSLAADFDLWVRFSKEAALYAVDAPLGGFRSHGDQKSANLSAYVAQARASLASHGGRPYSPAETAAHKAVLSRLPRRARRWAARAGLVDRRPICVYDGQRGGWYVDER